MKTNKIIYGALLIAMRIILQRFFGIQTPLSRISFAFVPAMMTGMFFNPITCGMIGVVTSVNSLTYLLTTRIPKYFITVPIHIVLFMAISKALQRTSQFKKIIHQV